MNHRRRETPKKPNNFFAAWKKLLVYSKQYWPAILLAVVLAAGGNLLNVLAPARLAAMTDVIVAGMETTINMNAITRIGLTVLALYGLSGAFSLIQGWMMAGVTQYITKGLRTDISDKIDRLPMKYFAETTVGDTLSRVTNDVDTIGSTLNMSLLNFISAVTMLVGSFVMMLITNRLLTLTAVGATFIGLALMGLIMGRSQKYFVAQQNQLGAINGHIEETYTGHTVVKVYNAEAKVRQEFTVMNRSLRDSAFRAQALSGLMMPIMTFIGNFGYVAVSVVGAMLALRGTISFGVIVAFIMYVRYFTQPLSQIAQAFQSLQSAAAAGERVFEMLEAEEMADESHKSLRVEKSDGQVTFSEVEFAYDEDGQRVIKDFSVAAQPGQKIAIVGHTGAGKTTMMNLLMRFYEMDRGDITIDGVSIGDITKENLRDQFCMVLQDSWVFEGTVRENLIFNTSDVTEEKMVSACEVVGLDHFIRTLPEGYDTVLDETANLSQGQKQQLTIARALIADKPMLILDEATSSVDTRTELKIQAAMDLLMEGRTTFVIAHRLSTIRNADNILVMEDGQIIESGTHADLMAQDGFYTDLYNSQFARAVQVV